MTQSTVFISRLSLPNLLDPTNLHFENELSSYCQCVSSILLLAAAGFTLVLSGTVATASTHSIDVLTIASPGVAAGNQVVGGARGRCVNMTTTIAMTKRKQVVAMMKNETSSTSSRRPSSTKSGELADNGADGGLAMVKKRFGKLESTEYNSYNLLDAVSGERYDQLRKKLHSWAYHGHLRGSILH
ncbi:LOW QUALITY PROTEIN: hypothetical protein PHMEG_00035878 [Phytophthora megakarya]|uniref:RxLR effector protein n=1 Tax=Phytophthora megakarya TaxID=4795 RepID=A0A225UME0_9STRA|nr:LOW QUALITY PROTEIN: hypothetical protein PHMEG_00035878 [Phytophthora megakarya]